MLNHPTIDCGSSSAKVRDMGVCAVGKSRSSREEHANANANANADADLIRHECALYSCSYEEEYGCEYGYGYPDKARAPLTFSEGPPSVPV